MGNSDKRILVKIAYYYYRLGMTQGEIAQKLSISRQKVNRLVKALIEEGIVEIKINGYENYHIDLERKLEKEFGLQEALIVPGVQGESTLEKLGMAGAGYLSKVVDDNCVLGVSWGNTLSAVAVNLASEPKRNVSVVQMVGGLNLKNISIKAEEITNIIARKFEGAPYLMYAPAVVRDTKVKEALKSDQSIKKIFNLIKKCKVALVGIGALSKDSTLFKENYLSCADLRELREANCVGDICSRYYDINGNLVSDHISSRVMSPEMADLQNIDLVIGVAAGEEKADAIFGALKGQYLDVLITDNVTGEEILKKC
ncbi:MAG: sugar-binding transcriptional regulator [Peptococcaceae bacterium]